MTLPPVIHIRWGLRTGRPSDPEITVRQERLVPYLAQIATLSVTYGLLRRLRAPRLVIAVVISVAGAIVIITGVTTVWKMSMHLTGAAFVPGDPNYNPDDSGMDSIHCHI